jgi:hypothetical protein
MKKSLIILFLGILFLTLTFAAENTNQNEVPETVTSPSFEENKENIQKTTTEILNELKERTKEAAENESLRQDNITKMFTTPLPEIMEKPTRIIFNIEEGEEVGLERFVVLAGCLIIFLFTLYDLLLFSSFSEEINSILAICLTVIASLMGQITRFADGFYTIIDKIKFLGGLDRKTIFITLLVTIIILVLIKFFGNELKKKKRVNKSFLMGTKTRIAQNQLEKNSKDFSDALSQE